MSTITIFVFLDGVEFLDGAEESLYSSLPLPEKILHTQQASSTQHPFMLALVWML